MSEVSIIVPTHNEEETVAILLKRINDSFQRNKGYLYEIIVVDNNSDDNTLRIVEDLKNKFNLKVLSNQTDNGKANSILEAVKNSRYENIAIIDADLEYPPESIISMLDLLGKKSDVIVAKRKNIKKGLVRSFLRKTYHFIFCKLLHSLDQDVQAGLKVFKKEILERVNIKPSPWSFDIEFLHKAKKAGYKILSYEVLAREKKTRKTNFELIDISFELGLSALKLKFEKDEPIPFSPKMKEVEGQGFHFNGQKYINHTNLNLTETAFKSLSVQQKTLLFLSLVIILGLFYINWHFSTIYFIAFVTVLYISDLLFNFYLIIKSLDSSKKYLNENLSISALSDNDLPLYSVLVPLYKESQVLPQFVQAMERLNYPKDKLQVLLLLEENDKETIDAANNINLPSYFEIIKIPHSVPKTKPKACNYGLGFVKGKYSVIYDAEDIPDPMQLKEAVYTFSKVDKNTICLQAKLNYFNPHQNILTTLFTAEYSLWFDLILPGLQAIHAPIPLGGTSNHFHTKFLKGVHGWDAFNVTEDCDLGMRLFKYGYKTRMIYSTTLEEANSNVGSWINQRSRWIKGYIQTYFVHMRNPVELAKKMGIKSFLEFQLTVGGKIFTTLVNPLMWITTTLYFIDRFGPVGNLIQSLFPPAVFYLGVTSFIVGNFLNLYSYMIGSLIRSHYSIIKYVYLVPFYWILMSFAGWKAVFNLIVNPHYWAKTKHGLYLQTPQQLSTNLSLKNNAK